MKHIRQTIFGEGKGNCYATCLAMILGLELDDVPNIAGEVPPEEWWGELQKWLGKHGLSMMEIGLDVPFKFFALEGTKCILSGKSPRGEFNHSVVGHFSEERGFCYEYDPHPSDAFLDGSVQSAGILVPLCPGQVFMDSWSRNVGIAIDRAVQKSVEHGEPDALRKLRALDAFCEAPEGEGLADLITSDKGAADERE
jgi:hypothetical protein